MFLYSGTSTQFIEAVIQNQIAERLKAAFFAYYRYNPSPSEVASWRNSLRALSQVFERADLNDHGVILEFELPMNSRRLDCLICGKDKSLKDNAVIIELKQWEKYEEAEGINEVMTRLGGGLHEALHPAVQVGQYKSYLKELHTEFDEERAGIHLEACSYLHNYSYSESDHLFAKKFEKIINENPLFTADDFYKLVSYLVSRLSKGGGADILTRIESGRYRPTKKLMEHVGEVIHGNPQYTLLDEQQVVYDRVLASTKNGFIDKQKTVIIVKGGPGTGKSVIAMNLMADLLLKEGYNAVYATGSKAFTETLRKIVGDRGAVQFKYFNSFTKAEANAIDVLICDEAHRLRKTSSSRFMRAEGPQIDEVMNVGKVLVFFIDEQQVVRMDEVGSVQYIRDFAMKNNCKIFEYELEAQFRCGGSEGFINWVNNTLGIKRTPNILWNSNESFDFKIFSSPLELEEAIKQKNNEGYKARMTAGFCWPWSDPDENGNLITDIQIGDYKRPWNARPDAKKLAKGIPKSFLWAHDNNGLPQVGCVYTAQGFEFDYVGVIFGKDLVYRLNEQAWIGQKEFSEDSNLKKSKERLVELLKNVYRVLLTRGMKGCYVFFEDKETEQFFKSRLEN